MEALSQGKSVVVGKHGGLLELIADGETGLVVTPGDARDLTEEIVLLLRDTDLRRTDWRAGQGNGSPVLHCGEDGSGIGEDLPRGLWSWRQRAA